MLVLVGCAGEPPPQLESTFSMADHSLAFANFTEGYEASTMDAALMQRMFGAEVCADDASPCQLKPSALAFMERANRSMEGGRCEGFAVLASLFEAQKLTPEDFGAPTARELTLPGNEPLQRELAYWFTTQLVPGVADKGAKQYMAKEVMPALVEGLKKGAKERWRIGIVRKKGKVISGGHSLTPIGYYSDPTEKGVYWLRVYDNNKPDAERLMKIDVKNNRWEFEASDNPKSAPRLYYGDAENQNPLYLSPILVRQGTLPCFFCADEGETQITTTGGAQASLETSSGTAGVVDGNLVGDTLPNFSADNDDQPGEFTTTVRSGATYKLTVSRPEDAEFNSAFQSVELASSNFNVVASNLQVFGSDQLQIENGGGTVTYSSESRSSVTLKSQVTLADGRTLEVQAVVAGSSSGVKVGIDPETGAVSVTANDSSGSQVTMVVTSTSATGEKTTGQLTFTSQGEGSVTANTTGWQQGEALTGTVTNNGSSTTATSACLDGKKSGVETDVDCGEVCTTKCSIAQGCKTGADCESTFCHATNKTCVATSCEDARRSGDETDVDCGGSTCSARCAVGKVCTQSSDCASTAACVTGVCVSTWAVGFTVSGLPTPGQLTVQNNGGDALTISGNGSFVFPTRVLGPYAVTIQTQPSTATCSVTNGSGAATGTTATVSITCTPTWAVGGTASGLPAGATVVLANGADTVAVAANGNFSFPVRTLGAYAVTIQTQPATALCNLGNASGTATADVTDVTVSCTPTWSVGGSVSGLLMGQTVTLANGADVLPLSLNGGFSFPTRTLGPYAVTIQAQPAGAVCNLTNGTGTATANVTDVTVTCAPSYSIGGMLSGLPGGETVTLLNGAESLPLSADGGFTFVTRTAGPYAVTVQIQPATAFCSVTNGSGTATGDVTNVSVSCVPTYSIGGMLSGLPGGETVTLLNGAEGLPLSADGGFTFTGRTPGPYAVTVQVQPATAFCSVTNGSGTATGDVTNVSVSCVPTYSIGGMLSGLPGGETVTLLNGPETLPLSANGGFTFATRTPGPYVVTVQTQPATAFCLVTNGSGTATGNVTNVSVTCQSSGTLDTSFNGTGWLSHSHATGSDLWRDGVVTPDGSMVFVGQSEVGAGDNDIVVSKVTSAGAFDTGFGTNGHATISNGAAIESGAKIFLEPMGGYIVAGTLAGMADPDFGLVKLLPNGAPDPTFGVNGIVTHDTGEWEYAEDAAVDAQGRYVLVGRTSVGGAGPHDVLVARLDATGNLDMGFGAGGWVVYDAGGNESANAVAIDAVTGDIVVIGEAGGDTLLLRFDSTGAPVNTFGTNGVAVLDLSGAGLGELMYAGLDDGTGTLLVGRVDNATPDSDLVVARIDATGALDNTFGTGGRLVVDRTGNEVGYAIAPAPGGGWYVGGHRDGLMLVTRLLPTGAVDTTFATSGFFENNFGTSALAYQVLVDQQGLVVAAGAIRSTSENLGVCRITP